MGIAWTEETWNPVTGCTKVSPGCKFCYAEWIVEVMWKQDFKQVTPHPERLDQPLHWRKPRLVFVNSMSDLYHEALSEDFIVRVFDVMERASRHTFQILTKRAERLAELAPRLPWPPNIWQGVSVENADAKHLGRIDYLRQVPAAVRFLSVEPLLGPIPNLPLDGIHWVIVGGESGMKSPERALVKDLGKKGRRSWWPKPETVPWVREIRDQCVATGVRFFFKQWGGPKSWSGGRVLDGLIWHQFPNGAGGVYDALLFSGEDPAALDLDEESLLDEEARLTWPGQDPAAFDDEET